MTPLMLLKIRTCADYTGAKVFIGKRRDNNSAPRPLRNGMNDVIGIKKNCHVAYHAAVCKCNDVARFSLFKLNRHAGIPQPF